MMRHNDSPNETAPDSGKSTETGITDLITTAEIKAGDTLDGKIKATAIFFIVSGDCVLYPGKNRRMELCHGNAIVLPIAMEFRLEAVTNLTILSFTVDERVRSEQIFSTFPGPPRPGRGVLCSLPINEKLWMFLSGTLSFMRDGLMNNQYQQIKMGELFLVLRAYYPEKMLKAFLNPLYSRNAWFARLVYENWYSAETLDRLAEITGLSLSGFSKRFKKIFGVAPYQWVMDRKSERILAELQSGKKSIKQLTEEYNFYSVQHFGYYCKKRFGLPPGRIRRQGNRKIKVKQ